MKAFMFKAAWLCEGCGNFTRQELTEQGKAPVDTENESSYDSDNFPKGPFGSGGGESDSPEHCDKCGEFLENSLTAHGLAYVQEAINEWHENRANGKTNDESWLILRQWSQFYGIAFESTSLA